VATERNFEVVYQFMLPDLYSLLFFRWKEIPPFGVQQEIRRQIEKTLLLFFFSAPIIYTQGNQNTGSVLSTNIIQ
jgi:hypothetical protein